MSDRERILKGRVKDMIRLVSLNDPKGHHPWDGVYFHSEVERWVDEQYNRKAPKDDWCAPDLVASVETRIENVPDGRHDNVDVYGRYAMLVVWRTVLSHAPIAEYDPQKAPGTADDAEIFDRERKMIVHVPKEEFLKQPPKDFFFLSWARRIIRPRGLIVFMDDMKSVEKALKALADKPIFL